MRRIVTVGVWLTIVAVAAQSLTDLANEYLLSEPKPDLNPSHEGNLFGWASAAASYSAGLAALLYAAVERRRRVAFLLIGAIFVYFSADDLLELHEQANEALRVGLPAAIENRLDIVVFAPLFFGLLIALLSVREDVPRGARNVLYAGMACLVVSVVFDEVIGEITLRLREDGLGWPDVVKGVFEEGFELGGVLLLATAMTAAAVAAISRRGPNGTSDRIVMAGVIAAAFAFAVQSVLDVVGEFPLDDEFFHLNTSAERNVFTWLSVVSLLSGGFLALVHAAVLPARRYAYLALGAALCALSADDLVEAFERVAERLPVALGDPIERRRVLLFELPVQLAALALGWWLAAGWTRRARAAGRVGVVLYALAILLNNALLEATDRLRDSRYDALAPLKGTLEEGLEVAGALLLAAGLASALVARLGRKEGPPGKEALGRLFYPRGG